MPYQPASSSSNYRYSYIWARSIVNQALEKHARVRETFLEFTGLSTDQLALLLAKGRPEWHFFRYMLAQGDRWALCQERLGKNYARQDQISAWKEIFARKRAGLPEPVQLYLDKQKKLFDA